MSFPGDTKTAFCPICNHDTEWVYTEVTRADGVFGLQNVIDPEAHQVKFWRCTNHSTPDGRIKPEFQHAGHHERYLPHK